MAGSSISLVVVYEQLVSVTHSETPIMIDHESIYTSCNAKVNTNLGLGAALMGGGVVGTPDLPRKPSFMVVSRVERTRGRVH